MGHFRTHWDVFRRFLTCGSFVDVLDILEYFWDILGNLRFWHDFGHIGRFSDVLENLGCIGMLHLGMFWDILKRFVTFLEVFGSFGSFLDVWEA